RAGNELRALTMNSRRLSGTARPPAVPERSARDDYLVDAVAAIVDRLEHCIEDRRIRIPHPAADSAHGGARVAGFAAFDNAAPEVFNASEWPGSSPGSLSSARMPRRLRASCGTGS